jgi:enterobactin synthetase component D
MTSADVVMLTQGRVSERFVPFDVPAVIRAFGPAHGVSLAESDADSMESHVAEVASVVAPEWFHRAVRSRQRGYVAGRHCASEALTGIGSTAARHPVPTGAFGAPQWPAGVSGSITHSVRFAIAVVAPVDRWRSLGIDCEPIIDASTAAELAERIVPEQRDVVWLGEAHPTPSFEEALTIGFAAKESIYKCLNPVVNEFFGFEAVRLDAIDMGDGTAHFTVVQSLGETFPQATPLTVRFTLQDGHVFAACGLPAT